MCEAEEILNWLCDELKLKSKECLDSVKGAVRTLQDRVNFEDRYEQNRAVDAVLEIEGSSDELLGLVREARQRVKEAGQKVAA